jgi:hypothetical protein
MAPAHILLREIRRFLLKSVSHIFPAILPSQPKGHQLLDWCFL